jgi:Fibronectin type III domain
LCLVKTAVWVFAAIVALNVLLVGVRALEVFVRRYRIERSRRRLERIGQVTRLPSAALTDHDRLRKAAGLLAATAAVWAVLGAGGLWSAQGNVSALGIDTGGVQTSWDVPDGAQNGRVPAQGGPGSGGAGAGAAPTDAAAVVPNTTAADAGAPSAVAALAASPTAIRLAWTGVAGANGYRVQRSDDGTTWVRIASTDRGETSYTDLGLESGTTYFYRVLAVTPAGDVLASDAVSATTAVDPLDAPTVTAASNSSTTIDLSWSDVANETGYRIERSSDGVQGWTTIATTGQDVTAYTDAGLSPETTYFYRVFTDGAGTESAPSNVTSATTQAAPDPDPVSQDPVAADTQESATTSP